ncbi:MAG: class I SAM-dependent DNA methyltransferase [Acidimicrobiia bacterium]
MEGYEPITTFGEETAAVYDEISTRGDEGATVEFLAQLASDGPALELAIGTGRIALPLAARGIPVDGIDISPAMVAKLRAKPGGDQIAVTIGDFAEVPIDGTYRLVFVVFNTLFNLLTQDDQVRCFQNVTAHLTRDGSFVVEALVPDLTQFRNDQYVEAEAIGVEHVRLDVGRHDAAVQRLDESHVFLSAEGVRLIPIVTRYAWPSELDLMARIAGLRLKERWAGWDREPFTSASRNCISVYGR